MAAAGRVLGQQDLARLQDEVLAAARLEIERAAQRDHELADRGGMPFEGAAGPGFLEGGMRGAELAGEEIAARAGLEIDEALLGMRILVLASPKTHTPDHRLGSLAVLTLVAGDRSMGRFPKQQSGREAPIAYVPRGRVRPRGGRIRRP